MKLSLPRLATLFAGLVLAGSVLAQNFPAKPVTLMVPYPPGGLSDVIARTLNTTLAKQLGQPVIVENLGGASGGIAAQKVLSAPADGYMVFQGSPNELIGAAGQRRHQVQERGLSSGADDLDQPDGHVCPQGPSRQRWG